jgi:hypothetical protein
MVTNNFFVSISDIPSYFTNNSIMLVLRANFVYAIENFPSHATTTTKYFSEGGIKK